MQDTQFEVFVDAVSPEYLPTAQSMHNETPVTSAYLPAEQFVHTLALVFAEYRPLAQSMHTTNPATSLYLPDTSSAISTH